MILKSKNMLSRILLVAIFLWPSGGMSQESDLDNLLAAGLLDCMEETKSIDLAYRQEIQVSCAALFVEKCDFRFTCFEVGRLLLDEMAENIRSKLPSEISGSPTGSITYRRIKKKYDERSDVRSCATTDQIDLSFCEFYNSSYRLMNIYKLEALSQRASR